MLGQTHYSFFLTCALPHHTFLSSPFSSSSPFYTLRRAPIFFFAFTTTTTTMTTRNNNPASIQVLAASLISLPSLSCALLHSARPKVWTVFLCIKAMYAQRARRVHAQCTLYILQLWPDHGYFPSPQQLQKVSPNRCIFSPQTPPSSPYT